MSKKEVWIITDPGELRQMISDTVRETLQEAMRQIENENEVLTKKAACRQLGIGYKKLNRLIRDGHIRVTTDGKITRRALNEYIRQTTVK